MGRRRKSGKLDETTSKKLEDKNATVDNAARSDPIEEKFVKSCENPIKPKLLDIYARLELPLFKSTENNLSTDSDDEERLEFHIRPRFVFSHSMCLVCMRTSEKSITCDGCKMISYCTIEHMRENRDNHRRLCEVLSKEFGGMEAFRSAEEATPDLYRSLRIKMIDLIEEKMSRSLDLWEREIILYPRICRTCRKMGDDLSRCKDCLIDFYCQHHAEDHATWCKAYRVFRRVLWMQHRHGCVSPTFPDVIIRRNVGPLAENVDQFFLDMFDNNVNYRRIDAHTYASMSLSATAPLTALFALRRARDDSTDRETLRIDIVGAEFQFECADLRVWEKLFLHYLPKLRKLSLEFSGPELHLPDAPRELLSRVALCRRCKRDKRRIVVSFEEKKLYHEIDGTSGPTADLICLFNPGLYRDTGYDGIDTWPKTIERFCRAKVPVVVTSYTEIEIPKDIERIRSIKNIKIIIEPQKNPFASVKPDRNFVSDDIVPLMYKNYCVSVIKGL